jgi:hypothetical protein
MSMAIDHSVRYRRYAIAMRSMTFSLFSSPSPSSEPFISLSYVLSKTTRPPSFCSRFWTLPEAYAVSGIASGLIEKAIRQNELESIHASQGVFLNAEEFRQWAYRTRPKIVGKRRFSLMQTGRMLGLQYQLVSAMEKACDYASKIDFPLPNDWIGLLIAEIHDRERAQRLAIEESLKIMEYN